MLNKKIIISLLVITAILIGTYTPHYISRLNNFVGIVGRHVYVDNSSQQKIPENGLSVLWGALYKGAPGYTLEAGRFATRRIKILESNINNDKKCGGFKIKLYTFFNIPFMEIDVNSPCA